MSYLFVYGTLRKDFGHIMHSVLVAQSDFVQFATVPGVMYEINHLSQYYPGVVLANRKQGRGKYRLGRVSGEVYHLHESTGILHQLDHYEECSRHFPRPHEFKRIQTRVRLANNEFLSAWIYVYQRRVDNLPVIRSGDFLKHTLRGSKADQGGLPS